MKSRKEKKIDSKAAPENRREKMKIILIASALILCTVFSVCNTIYGINLIAYYYSSEIIIGNSLSIGQENMCPDVPYSNDFICKLVMQSNKYDPDEEITIKLYYGLSSSLGPGDLSITIINPDFDIDTDNEILIEDFTLDNYANPENGFACEKEIHIVPNNEDTVYDNFYIYFAFIPDSYETFPYQSYWDSLYNGRLGLKTFCLSYVINEFQTVFEEGQSVIDLYEITLCSQYSVRKINAKDFAQRYYDMQYADTVCAAINTYAQDGRIRFFYLSKSVRYSSDMIDDAALLAKENECKAAEADFDAENSKRLRKEFAVMCLDLMLDCGVITEREYNSECAWMNECVHVNSSSAFYDQNVTQYKYVLEKYLYNR